MIMMLIKIPGIARKKIASAKIHQIRRIPK